MNTTLCNMVMIEDVDTKSVLVQHRLLNAINPWGGLTFPGGHVEPQRGITGSKLHRLLRKLQQLTNMKNNFIPHYGA